MEEKGQYVILRCRSCNAKIAFASMSESMALTLFSLTDYQCHRCFKMEGEHDPEKSVYDFPVPKMCKAVHV